MKTTFIDKTAVKVGDMTVLGVVTEQPKISPSGKTMMLTVKLHSGKDFTDRVSTAGKMAIFTEDADA
jgi:hypothetical protein